MSWIKSANLSRFSYLSQRVVNWIVYFLFLFIVAEVSASYALDLYRKYRSDATNYWELNPDLAQELSFVQKAATLSLYRWYQNLPNFRGQHIITDATGFRIDPQTLDDRIKVGMFGGSTTFSVLTDQSGTIADQISKKSDLYQVLNFGVGGYSSSAEIMTFVEAIRAYPSLKIAFFYDGVNELGRAIEGNFKDIGIKDSEFYLGTPYVEGVQNAIKNYNGYGFSLSQSQLYYIYRKILGPLSKPPISLESHEFLHSIKERYFQNVKVLSGICREYKVKCFYVVQPVIHTVGLSALHESELKIKNNDYYGRVYPKLIEMIFSDSRANSYGLVNLTASLNSKARTEIVFHDWHHLNSLGNGYIADALKLEIDNHLVRR